MSNKSYLLFLSQLAIRTLSKLDTLPELARFAHISTLELVQILDSKEYAAAKDVCRRRYANHVAEELGIEIPGETDQARYNEARKHSRELSPYSKQPDGWG